MTLHFARGVALVLTLLPASLAAQEKEPWRNSFYPVIYYTGNDGLGLGAEVTWTKRAPWDATFPHRAQLSVEAAYSTAGSYTALATLSAPGLSPDWRLHAEAGGESQAHFEFYGLGDTATWNKSLATGADKYYYNLERRRLVSDVEVSRRLHGHLWLAAAGAYNHVRFDPLSGNSVFKQMNPGGPLIDDDATGRLSLVLDTRDNEYDTRRGLLLETGALAGSGGGGYQRYTTVLRGWKAFGDYNTWWIDGRVLASSTSGAPPLDAKFFLQTWENSIRSFGGVETNRGLVDQRYAGRDVLAANLNVNRDLVNVGLYGAVSIHAFVDAGRVFENEGFSLTTNGMQVGGGAGFALRFGRTAIYTFNFAEGPDGFVFTLGNGWMF